MKINPNWRRSRTKNFIRSRKKGKNYTATNAVKYTLLGLVAVVLIFTIGIGIYGNSILDNITFIDRDDSTPSNLDEIILNDDGTEAQGEQLSPEELAALQDALLNDEDSPAYRETDVINILILGLDSRNKNERARSDSIIVLSINKKLKRITMSSLMRDICVAIPGRSSLDRLNTAYAYGGADLAIKTVEKNFKIAIDYFVSLDFFSFITIIDELGGITLDISEAERLVMNDYVAEINRLQNKPEESGFLMKTGKNIKVTGKQALGYARNRYTGNADFQRTERQRIVLDKIIEKLKDANAVQLLGFVNALSGYVTTDMTKSQIVGMIPLVAAAKDWPVNQFRVPQDKTWNYAMINSMSIVQIDFAKNRKALIDAIYN